MKRILFVLIFLIFLASACDPLQTPELSDGTAQISAQKPTKEEPTPTLALPTAIPTGEPIRVWFDPSLATALTENGLSDLISRYGTEAEDAAFRFGFLPEAPVSQWVYALAAPFKTVVDSVNFEDLQGFWSHGGSFTAAELCVSDADKAALGSILGSAGQSVRIVPEDEIDACLSGNQQSWALIPFENINPRLKIIAIEGQSPLHKDFDPTTYPLIVPIGLTALSDPGRDEEKSAALMEELTRVLPKSNRDPEKLTTIVLTGVTALARATAKEMELNGVLSAAVSIGELMREADFAHVSNEVPFARDCPPPQWVQEVDLVFCSDVKYIDLMEEIGTDIVELTGDHFADWGPEAMYLTLEMYRDKGWHYYGGGWDINEARQPLKIEHNGNKIAFLGCNAKAPGYATASETVPGALHCDMDDLADRVSQLKQEGYLVIVTFQHQEIYRWDPTEEMISDSHRAADAGATIVSGSQAHQPHIYEFYGDTFIHYGLGNLFFDQLGWFEDSNKAFLDRHIFYDGRYLGVEFITAQFFNWSTPTLMTPEARAEMLTRFFEYSR